MSMRTVDRAVIENLKKEARRSTRLRAHYTFHRPEDAVQRMVNVMMRDTYVPVHKHEKPDKVEHFVIIEGEVACVVFDASGTVKDHTILSRERGVWAVDLLPRTYHTFLCLSPVAVLMEFIEGPYDPATHKKLANFAPKEGSGEAPEFINQLILHIGQLEKEHA